MWLRMHEATKYAKVCKTTLRKWIKNGLTASNPSRKLLLIHTDDIDSYIRSYQLRDNAIDDIFNDLRKELE
ncbi:DNA binding domain protein, excisionase family [Candidatus Magnetomorum sp. HK-1]|nr:DNA binding domain protein, excisionase family [Candidatus Magnetomorum sp. HK-1]